MYLRVAATSGVAAMSLKGTTIDWFIGRGRRKIKMSKVEVCVRTWVMLRF